MGPDKPVIPGQRLFQVSELSSVWNVCATCTCMCSMLPGKIKPLSLSCLAICAEIILVQFRKIMQGWSTTVVGV